MKRWSFSLFLLPLLFAGFVFGVAKLFQLRFDQGDVYPPSSSLRSDPLGAKVFYESLRNLNSFELGRHYEPLHKIDSGRGKTLFILGVGAWDLNRVPRQDVKDIEKFLFDGGRIVISFQPMTGKSWNARREEKRAQEEKKKKEQKEEKSKAKKSDKKKPPLADDEVEVVSLLKNWQLELSFEDLATDDDGVAVPVTVERTADLDSLPPTLSWHTALYLDALTNSWRKVYALNNTNAAVVERQFGKGSVVLSSDSYLFSNEAMRKERHAELLAWFVGANREVIFDETHLGVEANPGIAALARKYRLHGLIAGLFLLAGLFVWKNSVSFVPPQDDDLFEGRSAMVAGKESSAGFVNLLRRSISPEEILPTCFAEWKKSGAHQRQKAFGKMEKIETLIRGESSRPRRERNPVQSYRNISTQLAERK